MGAMTVPSDALYGATTQRAVLNFPVSGRPVPPTVIHAFCLLKKACAEANGQLKKLDERRVRLISRACEEIAAALADENGSATASMMQQFPIDIFQTGSGTSTNMNANEVIAHRSNEILKGSSVHPNDHVNFGQSSNDVFPTEWDCLRDRVGPTWPSA